MTVVRTVATHEVVSSVFPRPVREGDELAMAIGKAIDTALGKYSFEAGRGRRLRISAAVAIGLREFDELCRDADLHPPEPVRAGIEMEVQRVVRAFRGSVLYGLERPRSRLVLIDESVGVYAQPDYWDRSARFYEMKSYRAIPPPPDIALQVAIFQLAFPGFQAFLVGFDRHSDPVDVRIAEVPSPPEADRARALRSAFEVGRRTGREKVLEYIDVPVIRYRLPPDPPTDPSGGARFPAPGPSRESD